MAKTSQDSICLNGINGITGDYLVPPLSPEDAAGMARREREREPEDRGLAKWLRSTRDVLLQPFYALPYDVDPQDLAQAGWGIVFAEGTPQAVRAALEPLIAHRRGQIPDAARCKELDYRAGESWKDWLARHGVYPGSVAPAKVPYYLALVGDPTAIPFEFQSLLDIEYAVGRIAFDQVQHYEQYARGVKDYETSAAVPTSREVVFWGTRHDRCTEMSADFLIRPLLAGMPVGGGELGESAIAEDLGYTSRSFLARQATKANLLEVLHASGTPRRPSMLVTASHGLGLPSGHPEQRARSGALLCQDWSGFGSIRPTDYLDAADIPAEARVHGLVAFHFACYSAGTPAFDHFLLAKQTGHPDRARGPLPIAERPFVAALPQRLLSHPQGGALAVIGHVERAWGYSIKPPGLGPQLTPFRNLLGRILAGEPVGHATTDLSQKYAALAADLLARLDPALPGGRQSTDARLAWTWVERNDAQNYVVLGDPAVRLRAESLE